MEPRSYDLVHCRLLLEHLRDPLQVLGGVTAALRPGGVLLAEDFDYGMFHFDGHPDADLMNSSFTRAAVEARNTKYLDIYIGRRLPGLLALAGLDVIDSEIAIEVARPGDPRFESHRTTEDQAWPILIRLGFLTDAEATRPTLISR